ncbi:MAG: hypothetical protein H6861_00860 [Rhodospirillales bacterium]|nr:hypothetical protein [Rhodospirillales bacterium]
MSDLNPPNQENTSITIEYLAGTYNCSAEGAHLITAVSEHGNQIILQLDPDEHEDLISEWQRSVYGIVTASKELNKTKGTVHFKPIGTAASAHLN